MSISLWKESIGDGVDCGIHLLNNQYAIECRPHKTVSGSGECSVSISHICMGFQACWSSYLISYLLIYHILSQPHIWGRSGGQLLLLMLLFLSLSHVWLFCDPMDYNPPCSSVLGISQARIWEWAAISFSRGNSQLRDQICSPALAGGFFFFFFYHHWAIREVIITLNPMVLMMLRHTCVYGSVRGNSWVWGYCILRQWT